MVLRNLGNRIREERLRCRLTQERLAERVGCNESYIGQIERGTKNPSLETVVGIANALNVSVDYLLAENVNISQTDGLINELVSHIKHRDPEYVRLMINTNRLFAEYLNKRDEKKK